MKAASASAHANIALVKYWGKSDSDQNLPAVPSLSVTLEALRTHTRVRFDGNLDDDHFVLDGIPQTGRAHDRVVELLNRMRAIAGESQRAHVESKNAFPTAAGLASSASGFAALVSACDAALGLTLSPARLSSLARRCSASAARSLFGGFVELPASGESAAQVATSEHFPVKVLIAVCAKGPKPLGSTEAMERTRTTSPYYPAWLESAPRLFTRAKQAVLERDLETLGETMEHSTLLMHASMFGAVPPIVYWEPSTLRVLRRVQELRREGVFAYFTIDAGPHVKVLLEPSSEASVRGELALLPGVEDVIVSELGGPPSAKSVESP